MFGRKRKQKYIDWWYMPLGEIDTELLQTRALRLGKREGLHFYYIENWMNSYLGYNGSYEFANLKECTWEEVKDLPAEGTTHIITSKSPYAIFRIHGQQVKSYCIIGGWIGKQWYESPEPFEAPLIEEKEGD